MLDSIYNLMDTILPFQWLSYDFMKNALLAVLIVTPLFGLLSTMVVNNKMSFFADSLGHGAFTGIALGILFGGFVGSGLDRSGKFAMPFTGTEGSRPLPTSI